MIGEKYDLIAGESIYQGADYEKEFELADPATGQPYDLNGCTIVSQARKAWNDHAPAFTFSTYLDDDPRTGKFKLKVVSGTSAGILPGIYQYDAKLIDSSGRVHEVILPSKVKVVGSDTRTTQA